jgi:CheY-like chemotaxis protein
MTDDEPIDILLVEDNETDAEMTIRALRRKNLADKLAWVKDGAEALDFIFRRGAYESRSNGSPRVVLLDLKMPKVDGIEVLRQIKEHDDTKAMPVVMLTSSAEERDIAASYAFGVNSYVVKPVDFSSFASEVAKAGSYWVLVNRLPAQIEHQSQ